MDVAFSRNFDSSFVTEEHEQKIDSESHVVSFLLWEDCSSRRSWSVTLPYLPLTALAQPLPRPPFQRSFLPL